MDGHIYDGRIVCTAGFYKEVSSFDEELQVSILKRLSKINSTGLTKDNLSQNVILPSELSKITISSFHTKVIAHGLGSEEAPYDIPAYDNPEDAVMKNITIAVQLGFRYPNKCTILVSKENEHDYLNHPKYRNEPYGLPTVDVLAGDKVYGKNGLLDVYLRAYEEKYPIPI